jgi:hypothetical protein
MVERTEYQKICHQMMLSACEFRKTFDRDEFRIPVPVNLVTARMFSKPDKMFMIEELAQQRIVMSKEVAEAYLRLHEHLLELAGYSDNICNLANGLSKTPLDQLDNWRNSIGYMARKLNNLAETFTKDDQDRQKNLYAV